MSRLLRCLSSRGLQVMLGLALMGLVLAPSTSGAAQLDTVAASGNSLIPGLFFNVTAQSTTSGQNPSGQASVQFGGFMGTTIAGPVTCLTVTGPDRGGGTVASPTTAVLNFQGTAQEGRLTIPVGIQTLEMVDNGGAGQDTYNFSNRDFTGMERAPADCSPLPNPPPMFGFLSGKATGSLTVFDAPLLPTSSAQCKNGGWRNYPQFKNQGQCVALVRQQARKGCAAERERIGRTAFRAKYGLGRYHLFALRRCVNAAAR